MWDLYGIRICGQLLGGDEVLRLMVMIVDNGVMCGCVWGVGVLERCRDGSYTVNALCCDMWVLFACLLVCIVTCFVGFWASAFWWKCIPT